jgi:hypothetical protein
LFHEFWTNFEFDMNFGSLHGFEMTWKMEKGFQIPKTGPGPISRRSAQLAAKKRPTRPGCVGPGSH